MTKLTIETLKEIIGSYPEDSDEIECVMARQLLAYEQAAKNPVAWDYEWASYITCEGPQDFNRIIEREAPPDWAIDEGQARNIIPLYAAPVLPKQPELVDLSQQVEILNRILNWILKELPVPTQKASAMAIRLSSVIDIISDLEVSAPAQPKQPKPTISFYRDGIIAAAKWVENQRDAYDNEHGQSDPETGSFEFGNNAQLEYSTTLSEIAEGIRSLHSVSAQPVSEPYKLPDGWKLVPLEPTAEMAQAARDCHEGESFLPYSIYRAMLAAAPAQESE